MTLTVLNVAYPLAPVGPDAVGGAEQILTQLDFALVRTGHTSLVLACAGSVAAGRLLSIPRPSGTLTEAVRQAAQVRHRRAIERTLRACRVDVVHLHGVDCVHYLPETETPVLITLHLPPDWYPPELFRLDRPHVHLHCVSPSQARACPAGARLLSPIENGVPLDRLRPRRHKHRFALALGRICPEKGFHLALDAARRAGVSLYLAGEVFGYEAHQRYFEQEIAPRLDDRRRFLGPLGLERKRRLLAAARCLLLPSLAPETSSLAAMEALACGTPVIAFPAGALPEIVEHGRTGFLVRDEREMAEAIAAADRLDPRACRAAAESRFSAERMSARYLERYRQLASEHAAAASTVSAPSFAPLPSLAPAPFTPTGLSTPAERAPAAPGLVIEELTTLTELESLGPAWWDLWRRCPGATPFQSPAWLLPWVRCFKPAEVWTLAVSGEQGLAALAPFFTPAEASSARKLLLLGTGNTDYLDVLIAPEHRPDALAAILRSVRERRPDWDICELHQLRAASPLWEFDRPGDEMLRRSTTRDVCPVLELPDGAGSLEDCLPPEQWRKWRYYQRRAERAGTVMIETARAENWEELFDALLRLHQARWGARELPGVLADNAVQAFHRAVAAALLAEGMLRLSALRLDGRIIAAFYGMCHARRTYYYLGGFDPQFKKLSPGMLVVGQAIDAALREGCVEFDFLRGAEPYKYAWGARDRPTFTLCLQRRPLLQPM